MAEDVAEATESLPKEAGHQVVWEEVRMIAAPAAFSLFSHGENKGGPGLLLQFFCQIRKPPARIKNTIQLNPASGTGFGSPQCGQVFALGETALLQTLHGFNSGFSSSGTATQ
jgi:hypothetical protein